MECVSGLPDLPDLPPQIITYILWLADVITVIDTQKYQYESYADLSRKYIMDFGVRDKTEIHNAGSTKYYIELSDMYGVKNVLKFHYNIWKEPDDENTLLNDSMHCSINDIWLLNYNGEFNSKLCNECHKR